MNDNSSSPENPSSTKSEDDDLPLTIKIDPPSIRDIDEEDDLEWSQPQKEILVRIILIVSKLRKITYWI